jgi:CHAT domain-containing protein
VEYLITEQDLIVFVLTRNELHGMNVPVTPADLQAKVELLRDLLLRRQETDWIGPATSLYRILVKPVREAGWLDGVERLRIVPHGILHYLPFATLVRPNGDGVRFLVEDYVLSYLPSAATLIRSHGTPSNGDDGLLTFAPQPARLPYTAEETEAISLAFPERHLLLSGRRATESAFRKRAERFRFIHFATHGYFNKLNPLLSGLELEADEHHDGQLQVREILSMRLAADLVTLSACQTALGSGYFVEVPPGDDFVGLTRAFLFAGSRAVLASLWEINDRSTATLMGDFYRHLGASSAADALAKAQRAMLGTDADYRHPYYWSAFILTGN